MRINIAAAAALAYIFTAHDDVVLFVRWLLRCDKR